MTDVYLNNQTTANIPICVRLEGALLKTDLCWESVVGLLRQNLFNVFPVFYWWLRGHNCLSRKLAAALRMDPASLPYHEKLVSWLRGERKSGRNIYLTAAFDQNVARAIAEHLGIFDEVIPVVGCGKLPNQTEVHVLNKKFGKQCFDYAGNSAEDFPVWRAAHAAVVVNASAAVKDELARCTRIDRVFDRTVSPVNAFIRSLRPHQWCKNLIVFVPIIAGHKITDHLICGRDFWAFLVFCVCASGVYIMNDLMDLDADRRHSTKHLRPFASGDLPLPMGLALAPLLLLAGLLAAVQLSWCFFGVVLIYLALTTAYTWKIKSIVLLDVFFLAGLYTIRLVAGHEATGLVYSSWLIMFSMFIFLSLALVKRYVELDAMKEFSPHVNGG